ncbi:MAG: class I SAM-dependent methyltransferase [Candidatus Omnitrophica bacterium]|nr:class I SAM-dependent methyltransferase [Candidatus Omnitrophota bacterium]
MVKCLICNGFSRLRFKSQSFKIYQCEDCKTSFLYPLPVNTEKIYDNNYFTLWYIKVYEERKKYFKNLLKKLKKYIPEKGKILDVGCGIGIFMSLMKENDYQVYGQDISSFALDFCKEKGFKVYNYLSEINSQEKFDTITMLDSIAHIKNPIDYLQKCKKLLKQNGVLIIKTPLHSNYLFMIAKILKFTIKEKSILHLPAQIFHFDKYSISKLAKLTGFKLKKIIIFKEFIDKKISFYNIWKLLIERSMIVILKNE